MIINMLFCLLMGMVAAFKFSDGEGAWGLLALSLLNGAVAIKLFG